jgi:phage head maturation protease
MQKEPSPITTNDGRDAVRGSLNIEIREPQSSGSEPILEFIASDESLDRYDEVICASGWKLANYQKNPIFQNNHQTGDIIHTLGRALVTEVRSLPSARNHQHDPHEVRNNNSGNSLVATLGKESTYLYQRIQFATEANPIARIAYGLYKGKFLNAVSVGFVPLRWVNGEGKEYVTHGKEYGVPALAGSDPSPIEIRKSKTENQYRRKYLEQELLEVSAVGLPANPNALALAYKSGAVEKSDLRDTYDLLRKALADPADRQRELHSFFRNVNALLKS